MQLSNTEIEDLFRTHFESLHRYAFTILKDSDVAKDAVQAVFLNLLEKRNSIHFEQSAKSYLFRSVYNQSINIIKKDDSLLKRNLEYIQLHSEIEKRNFEDANQEINKKIDSVLTHLPPQCRVVFVKSRMDQMKYTEIAADLGISVKTVEAHMSKALKLIRTALRVLVIVFCLLIEL